MSVVEELRQNDPETSIIIYLRDERSDADLAQALEQNPFVTEIEIDFHFRGREQRADWDSLLRVIATRANLEAVTLKDAHDPEERTAPTELVRAFLRAIQQNTAIRRVQLRWLRLPSNFSTFVDNASSITSYSIFGCDMEAAGRQQGGSDLAAALQRNTNIETLELSYLEDICAIPILEGLRLHTAVKTLNFSGDISDAASHALHQLLQSTTSIQKIGFHDIAFSSEILFRPIAQAITSSECMSELKFSYCRFGDRNSFAHFRSILQNKQNLTFLCLSGCRLGEGQVHEDIISILSRPESVLRCFQFFHDDLEQTLPDIQFKNLLQAIQISKLERFQIALIQTPQQVQTLTDTIPSMKLKELVLELFCEDEDDEFSPETIRQDLLHAVKNNFSLRSVEASLFSDNDESDLFESTEDKHSLACYANRNELLDQWVDHPETVEQRKVWPDALSLAQKAGPNSLFCGLRSVLERDYVSLPSGRKRKRPQIYAPS